MVPYLYHYTSVEVVKLILAEKKIKFSNLAKMDDLDEGSTGNLKNFREMVYTSSWTADYVESLPLWKFYSGDMTGVRIALPINPFQSNEDGECEELLELQIKNPVKRKILFAKLYPELLPVTYTEDPVVLNMRPYEEAPDGAFRINPNFIGRFKTKYWEFQKEWRYRIFGYPFSNEEFHQTAKRKKDYIKKLCETRTGIEELYLTIRPEAFNKMVILCGPKTKKEDIEEIKKLMEENKLETELEFSKLNVR